MAIDKRISYAWGGPGGKSPGSGGPGPGGQGARGQATSNPGRTTKSAPSSSRQPGLEISNVKSVKTGPSKDMNDAREKAIEVAAKTIKTPTRSPHEDTPTQKKEQLAIDLSDFESEDKKVKAPKTLAPPKKTYERGVPFTDELVKTVTPPKYSPTYYQDRSKIGGETWGERAEQDMKRGFFDSGIGKALKWGATALAPQLLGPKLGQLYSGYKQAKFASDTLKQLGLTKTNLMSDLTSKSNVRDLLSRKTTTDTTTDTRDRGDGRQVTPEAPKADVVTESIKRFTQPQLIELQKRQATLQRYADKGALNERGQSTLMQLNQMLEQALASAAHGGFIDKPLMGRNRYL